MSKYSTIAVIYGSDSSEWEVSCRSGEFVASRIDGNVYDVYEIFARFGKWSLVAYKKRNSSRASTCSSRARYSTTIRVLGEKVKFDFAYLVQHGAPGETGQMQGYLEMLGIPCSTCGSMVSAIAFDKYACKCYIREQGVVKCAPDAFVRDGMDLEAFASGEVSRLKFPVFVKPTQGGSSFGVSRVTRAEDVVPAIRYAFSENSSVSGAGVERKGAHLRGLL